MYYTIVMLMYDYVNQETQLACYLILTYSYTQLVRLFLVPVTNYTVPVVLVLWRIAEEFV